MDGLRIKVEYNYEKANFNRLWDNRYSTNERWLISVEGRFVYSHNIYIDRNGRKNVEKSIYKGEVDNILRFVKDNISQFVDYLFLDIEGYHTHRSRK